MLKHILKNIMFFDFRVRSITSPFATSCLTLSTKVNQALHVMSSTNSDLNMFMNVNHLYSYIMLKGFEFIGNFLNFVDRLVTICSSVMNLRIFFCQPLSSIITVKILTQITWLSSIISMHLLPNADGILATGQSPSITLISMSQFIFPYCCPTGL